MSTNDRPRWEGLSRAGGLGGEVGARIPLGREMLRNFIPWL